MGDDGNTAGGAGAINNTVRLRFSSRDDVKRDIKEWAKPVRRGSKDAEAQEEDQSTMIGGQMKDNITEQRMLEGRLLDLSKERYKFMVQVAWQRKAFIDKQKRKTGMMKDLLKGVDTTTVQAGKKNQSERLNEKIDTYRKLVDSSYGEVSRQRKQQKRKVYHHNNMVQNCDDSLEEKIPIFPKPLRTASFAKTKRIFQTEVQVQPNIRLEKTKGFPIDIKRKVVFPNISDTQQKTIIDPHGHVNGRQSVPPDFMRRDVASSKRQTAADILRPSTQMQVRHSISAGTVIPRFLKYRASYDRSFSSLERMLTIPYDGPPPGTAVFSGADDMSSLLKQLPPTTPVPAIETTQVSH